MLIKPHFKKSLGFSLVEIMIGMVIALIGMLVIIQVYSTSEARKKVTTGSGDAQTNGAIALYNLQRELQMAGYGISSKEVMGCNLQLRAGVSLSGMAPIVINHASIPAGDANTDTIMVFYGNANGAAEGISINNNASSPSTSFTMSSYLGFNSNDKVIAQLETRSEPCNLTLDKITNYPENDEKPIIVENGTAITGKGWLFNLGKSPKLRVYAIRNNNLTVCNFVDINPTSGLDVGYDCSNTDLVNNANVWIPIANNIVSLRAQYGRDDTLGGMDGVVDGYSQSVATTTSTPAVNTVQCGWQRVLAVRLALVARNAQIDVSNVTTNAPTWSGSGQAAIDFSGISDWQKYRYKKFETQIPIKNTAWQVADTSCTEI